MLRLLLGTDWVANRDTVLNMVAKDVADEKPGRILMVPELISHDMERRLSEAAGDTASRFAEVLSFTRLARRVSDAVGHAAVSCLDNGGRVVAMASATRQLHSKLKAFAAVETKPEFLTGLLDAVDEFKRCCITPQMLLDAAKKTTGSFAQKLEELALILETYNSICANGKKDPRDQMQWLLEELSDCDFAKTHAFYIDGFPDFTRQHTEILSHLICNSENVVVSLNCDCVDSTAPAFAKAGDTAGQLLRIAKANGVAVEIINIKPYAHSTRKIAAKLLGGNLKPDSTLPLSVLQAESVYQEALVVAERILQLVQGGVRFRDIAVVCTDMSTYRNPLNMVFNRCKIPAYLSGTEALLEKSAITTVLAAMDAALGGFVQKDVLRYIKSMLSPLEPELCDRVENYVITWKINGSRWLKDWTAHPDGLSGVWDDAAFEKLGALNRARRIAVEPIERLYVGFKASINLKQQVLALYAFLEDIHLSERLDQLAKNMDAKGDNRSAQILNQLWEILLTAMEQLHDVLGNTVWDTQTFTQLFTILLGQYDVGTIPPVLDSVTVGPVSAMRCQQAKHTFVLGAVEGSFPSYGGSTGVLTDQEKSALRELGVPYTGGALEGLQAEFAEIYGVFCGAEETATVSYPGGQPSFVYTRLAKLAGGSENVVSELGVALADPDEAAAYLVRLNQKSVAEALNLSQQYSDVESRRKHSLGTVTTDNIKKLYGKKLRLSASQADKFADCRLSYFLKYGLRAKERKSADIDPAEFGTYIHAVLENTVREIKNRGGFQKVSLDEALALAMENSKAYADSRFQELDTQRLQYLFRRNQQELEMIVRELWQELYESGFQPVEFELAFGRDGKMPPIEIAGKQMDASISGFVDRVDAWESGEKTYFRVVDYKTGKKDFDYCDIANGLGLQMLLYLFALEMGGVSVLGKNPVPAGVQYFPARVPYVSADGVLSDEEAESERIKNWKRKGLILQDDAVLQAMEPGEKPKRLPYSRKKDGSISGDLADLQQFSLLKEYVFSVLSKMVDDIASGNVSPNPYMRGMSHNACRFCPYGAICNDSAGEGCRNFKAISANDFWEYVEKEMSKRGR